MDDRFQQLGNRFQVVLNPMLEDSLGQIWVGTKNGICKYSGSQITCYAHHPGDTSSIIGNDIENIVLDSRHRIWIAVKNKGIQIISLSGNPILHLEYQSDKEQSLQNNRIWGMWEDEENRMWISYFNGMLSSYDLNTGKFEHFNLNELSPEDPSRPKTVIDCIQDREEEDVYWLFTTNGIIRWNVNQKNGDAYLLRYNKEAAKLNPAIKENSSNWMRSVYQDDAGIFWIGTFGHFLKFDPLIKEYQIIFNTQHELKHIIGLTEFGKEELLISLPQGLALITKQKPYQVRLLNHAFPKDKHTDIMGRFYEASNGCLYIANTTANGPPGIYAICDQTNLIENHQLDHHVYRIASTENYLHYYDLDKNSICSWNLRNGKKSMFRFPAKNALYIRAYHDQGNDSLLIAGHNEVFQYHPNIGFQKIPPLSNMILDRNESIFQDSKGNIWTGNQRRGLFKYEPVKGEVRNYSVDTNPALVYSDYIMHMLEDNDGDLWISTEQGWSVYDSRNNAFRNYHNEQIQQTYGLGLSSKVAIHQARNGSIWIADRSFGILIWNKDQDTLVHKLALGSQINLNSIDRVDLDDQGRFWLLSRTSGLACVDPDNLEVRTFGKEYGFLETIYDIDISGDGQIFVGHKKGYYSFYMQDLMEYEEIPSLPIIDGFKIFDIPNDDLLTLGRAIQLEYDQNYFSFELASKNFQSADQENYEVRLDSFDEDWINLGDKRFKGYTNVPAGEYNFQLRIKTNNQDWSYSHPVSIRIKEVWYRTIWFRLIAAGLLAFLIYGYLKWRRQRDLEKASFEKQLALLETKALRTQMNPHFLFNSLNSIRYQIVSNETQKAADYLTKFSRLIRLILQNSEHEYVRLSDELDLLDLYVQMEKIRFKGSFEYQVTVDESINMNEILIPSMIIQPFVENAILHGINPLKGVGEIRLHIMKKGDDLLIRLEDNGVGRTKSQASKTTSLDRKSLGMKITRDRISLLKKGSSIDDITISDLYPEKENTGTRVMINLPYSIQNNSVNPNTK